MHQVFEIKKCCKIKYKKDNQIIREIILETL